MSVRELANEQTDFQSWAHSTDETLEQLETSADGLSETEASNRRKRFGPNLLETSKPASIWAILLKQFKSIVVLLLVAAGVVALLFGDYIEAAAIGLVLIINAAIGFFMELRGVRSMEALKKAGRYAIDRHPGWSAADCASPRTRTRGYAVTSGRRCRRGRRASYREQ